MRSLNRVSLIGHLAADVDFRQTKSGHLTASFPVATNYVVRLNDENKEIVDFHRIVAWGTLSELCNKLLKKGMAVYLDGHLKNRVYDDSSGVRQARTEIVLDDINILTWNKKKDSGVEVKPIKEESVMSKAK